MTTPIWLQDEPWLAKWLGWFLDRLDKSQDDDGGTARKKAITRRIKKNTTQPPKETRKSRIKY